MATQMLGSQPGVGALIRLTEEMKEILLAAHSKGQPLSLEMPSTQIGSVAILSIGGEAFTFSVTPQENMDLLQLPSPSHPATVLASLPNKLQPKRTLDAGVSGRMRAAGEQAAKRRQEGAAVQLGASEGMRIRASGPAVVKTTQRQVTPPPPALNSAPPSNTVAARTPPLPSTQPNATSRLQHASDRTQTNSPVSIQNQQPNKQALPQAARKSLQPPKPASMKGGVGSAAAHKALGGSGVGNSSSQSLKQLANQNTPPTAQADTTLPNSTGAAGGAANPSNGNTGQQGSVGAAAAAAPLADPPASAVAAAKHGDLTLVVVAVLNTTNRGMSAQALQRLVDASYKMAKKDGEKKEYVKRVIEVLTERVPPNRLQLKQEVADRELPRLANLVNNNSASAGTSSAAKGGSKGPNSRSTPTPASNGSSPDASLVSGQPSPALANELMADAAGPRNVVSAGAANNNGPVTSSGSGDVPGSGKKTQKRKLTEPGIAADTQMQKKARLVNASSTAAAEAAPARKAAKPEAKQTVKPSAKQAERAAVRSVGDWDDDDDEAFPTLPTRPPSTAPAPMPPMIEINKPESLYAGGGKPEKGSGPAGAHADMHGNAAGIGNGASAMVVAPPPPPVGSAPSSAPGGLQRTHPLLPNGNTQRQVTNAGSQHVSLPNGHSTHSPAPAHAQSRPTAIAAPSPPIQTHLSPDHVPDTQALARDSQIISPDVPSPAPSHRHSVPPTDIVRPGNTGLDTPAPSHMAATSRDSESHPSRPSSVPPVTQAAATMPAVDGAWARVEQPAEDPPAEAAEYAEFVSNTPPLPSLSTGPIAEALSNLEAEYRVRHTTHFKVRQKVNALLAELCGLRDSAAAASAAGDEAAAQRWRKELWLKGARHYKLLVTWQKALQGLGAWLEAARLLAADITMSDQTTGPADDNVNMPGGNGSNGAGSLALAAA